MFAHNMARIYRESHGMFVACGILFNHEGPRRGPEFVTRKITMGVAAIAQGSDKKIMLGNLDARRDWGYAPEYVKVMHEMFQRNEPEDFVIGTGVTRSIPEFLTAAFAAVDIDDLSDLDRASEWDSGIDDAGVGTPRKPVPR